jgi:hypothetical protein
MIPPVLHVELDVFSGRPNPVWSLSADSTEDLRARLARLDGLGHAGTPPEGQLGYRGFLVHRLDEDGHLRPWCRVVHRTVWMLEGDQWRTYRDSWGIEAWLRDRATEQGLAPLLAHTPPA